MRVTSILSVVALAFTLTACQEKPFDLKEYWLSFEESSNAKGNLELKLAAKFSAECLGMTPEQPYTIKRVDLSKVSAPKPYDEVWGLAYHDVALVSTVTEPMECSTVFVVAHELRHVQQWYEGWAFDPKTVPYEIRSQEVDANAHATRCLTDYVIQTGATCAQGRSTKEGYL